MYFNMPLFSAKHKAVVNADFLIPHRTSISNRVKTLNAETIEKKGAQIVRHVQEFGGSISVDYGKVFRDYISIFLHLIDNGAKHFSFNVAMLRCGHEKKTHDQVGEFFIYTV